MVLNLSYGNFSFTLFPQSTIIMQAPFVIKSVTLTPSSEVNYVLNMSWRCAFSICLKGNIDIEIMNRQYHIESKSLMICLPFADIKVLDVRCTSEIIFVEINRENFLGLSYANRSILSSNLSLIRQHPLVTTRDEEISGVRADVEKYQTEFKDQMANQSTETFVHIYQSLIEARSQVIMSLLLKLYFAHIPKHLLSHNNRDLVFQDFMMDLYSNYKQHHGVRFYADRSKLSLKYFSTLIRSLSGATPSEWIEMVVVGEAKNMLYDPHRNIKEIATALNFPDAPTFTKYFVRVAGLTPKAFRKSLI